LENKKYIVIDEISMTDAVLVGKIDQRCRQALNKDIPFGGLSVIFFGDFFQIPPTNGDPLYVSILKIANIIESKTQIDDTSPLHIGATLLTKFQYLEMEEQVRAKGPFLPFLLTIPLSPPFLTIPSPHSAPLSLFLPTLLSPLLTTLSHNPPPPYMLM
jgi:hypothetical protein